MNWAERWCDNEHTPCSIPPGNWVDSHSWDPTLLMDSRRQPDVERVEPSVIERVTKVTEEEEPLPGSIAWLYKDVGGEG